MLMLFQQLKGVILDSKFIYTIYYIPLLLMYIGFFEYLSNFMCKRELLLKMSWECDCVQAHALLLFVTTSIHQSFFPLPGGVFLAILLEILPILERWGP